MPTLYLGKSERPQYQEVKWVFVRLWLRDKWKKLQLKQSCICLSNTLSYTHDLLWLGKFRGQWQIQWMEVSGVFEGGTEGATARVRHRRPVGSERLWIPDHQSSLNCWFEGHDPTTPWTPRPWPLLQSAAGNSLCNLCRWPNTWCTWLVEFLGGKKAKEMLLALTSCLNPNNVLAFGAEGLSP